VLALAHEPGCEGGHSAGFTCAETLAWREQVRNNKWICWFGGNGYHRFNTTRPDAVCTYEGCGRRRGDLFHTD